MKKIEDLGCCGLVIVQDKDGYNFTSDAVLLANYFKAKSADIVVELCSGSGVISILGTKKTSARHFYCFEIQKTMCEDCLQSINLNKIKNIDVFNSDLKEAPNILNGKQIDVVVVNPPYFTDNIKSENLVVSTATHEVTTTLADVVQTASKLLKFGGKFYMVHTANRLAEICHCLICHNIQPKEIVLVKPTKNKDAKTVLITAIKNGKVGVKIKEIIVEN